MDFVTDRTWTVSASKTDGWEKPGDAPKDWVHAVELGDVSMTPWNLAGPFDRALATAAICGEVRSSLVDSNPLMTALSRPNREQVITTRNSTATTLQALELTNGSTLARLLKRGAEKLTKESPASGRDLVVSVFERGLGRKPNAVELRMSEELVGNPSKQDGVEDLLWAMTMLPEFQLIY
jgi:hypothetical protein